MAIIDIPTGILPEEIVNALPQVGEENKVYRRLVADETLREMQITDDFIWYDGEYHPFSFDARICGAYFARYQNSVQETVAELEQFVEDVKSGKKFATIKLTASSCPANLSWCLWDVEAGAEVQHNVFSMTQSASPRAYEVELLVKPGSYKFFNNNYILTRSGAEVEMNITDFGDYEIGTVSVEAKGGSK